jgi:hypothetical protein
VVVVEVDDVASVVSYTSSVDLAPEVVVTVAAEGDDFVAASENFLRQLRSVSSIFDSIEL